MIELNSPFGCGIPLLESANIICISVHFIFWKIELYKFWQKFTQGRSCFTEFWLICRYLRCSIRTSGKFLPEFEVVDFQQVQVPSVAPLYIFLLRYHGPRICHIWDETVQVSSGNFRETIGKIKISLNTLFFN